MPDTKGPIQSAGALEGVEVSVELLWRICCRSVVREVSLLPRARTNVVKDAVAATNDSFSLAKRIVSKTDTRGKDYPVAINSSLREAPCVDIQDAILQIPCIQHIQARIGTRPIGSCDRILSLCQSSYRILVGRGHIKDRRTCAIKQAWSKVIPSRQPLRHCPRKPNAIINR